MSDESIQEPMTPATQARGGLGERLARFGRRRGVRRVVAVGLPLVIVALLASIWPAYTVPGMNWTGFNGNTVWDWVQLLAAPVALSGGTLWFTRGDEPTPLKGLWQEARQGRWRAVGRVLWSGDVRVEELALFYASFVVALAITLLIVAIALIPLAFLYHWDWTGYLSGEQPDYSQPKKLWDWLTALLLPGAVAVATIRLHTHHQATQRNRAQDGERAGGAGAGGQVGDAGAG